MLRYVIGSFLTLIAVFYDGITPRGVVATKRAEMRTRIRYCVRAISERIEPVRFNPFG